MLGFILAVVAGWLTPVAEGPVARPLAKAMRPQVAVEEGEMRVLAFIFMMLVAGLLAEIFDSGSAFWVIAGGTLGFFGTRIVTWLRGVLGGRRR